MARIWLSANCIAWRKGVFKKPEGGTEGEARSAEELFCIEGVKNSKSVPQPATLELRCRQVAVVKEGGRVVRVRWGAGGLVGRRAFL